MSFYADLDTASLLGQGERHRAVGWLSSDHDFPRGKVDKAFLTLLKRHIASSFQPLACGGVHECELCHKNRDSGNLWIPTAEFVYVAPEMILHYIEDHEYCPPREFCDAVVACPAQGSPEYMQLMTPYLSYFEITPPDPLPTLQQQAQLAKLLTRAFNDIARLCRGGSSDAAGALAYACAEIPSGMHGWGLWYRHIFSRLVRNSRSKFPEIDEYLNEYNAIFGEDTDPELTAYTAAQAAAKLRAKETEN